MNKRYKGFQFFIATILSILVFCSFLSGQERTTLNIEKPNLSEILAEDDINCLLQDKLGFMWFGSWKGLYRYDGNQTVNYSLKRNGFLGKKISTLYSAHDSSLWIGTYGQGLYIYNINTNKTVNYDTICGQKIKNIYAIVQNPKGETYIGTSNNLYIYNKGKFTEFPLSREIGEKTTTLMITALQIDKFGNVWAGTSNGLFRFDTYSHTYMRILPEITTYVSKLLYHNDKIWICSKQGLHSLLPQLGGYSESHSVKINAEGTTEYVLNIRPSNQNKDIYWINTQNNFYIFNSQTGTSSPIDFMLNQKLTIKLHIQAVYEDRNNVLWIGAQGLYKFDNNLRNFATYTDLDKISSVMALAAGAGGSLWVGTWGNGLFYTTIDRKGNATELKPINFGSIFQASYARFTYSLCLSRAGTDLWIGTKGAGVVRLGLKNNQFAGSVKTYSSFERNGIEDDYIMNIYEDLEGNIWAGSWDGILYKYSPKTDRFMVIEYQKTTKIENQAAIVKISSARPGELLLGTFGNGLLRIQLSEDREKSLNSKTIFYLQGQENQFSNFITDILDAGNGNLLLATDKDLFLISQDNKYQHFGISDGLPHTTVEAVARDISGKFWASTSGGLSQLNFVDKKLKSVRNFTTYDRLHSNVFHSRCFTKAADGRMFFGGNNGFCSFIPGEIKESTSKTSVLLTEFKLFNEIVESGIEINGKILLEKTISKTGHLTLSYDENTFSFGFSALNYSMPEKIKYAYKLEGVNPNWVLADARYPYANYTKVRYGIYKFLVKCTNVDGIWSDKITTLTIEIRPPWWQTNWAYFIYFLLILGFIVLLKYMIEYKHQIEIKQVGYQKDLEVFDMQLKFYTNISHEFRTPLTIIIGLVDILRKKDENKDLRRDNYTKIDRNARILKKLIDDLLDMRKIEKDTLKLKLEKIDPAFLVKQLCDNFVYLFAQKNVQFEFQTQLTSQIYILADELRFESIIYNLLSNAFKFTPENGKVLCCINLVERSEQGNVFFIRKNMQKYLCITISDNGIGITPEDLPHIFDIFYTGSNDQTVNQQIGTGIGLPFTKKLVQLHKGQIEVSSTEGKGSEFSIYLPVIEETTDILSQQPAQPELIPINIKESPVPDENEDEKLAKDKELILVVDDSADLRAMVRDCLPSKYQVLEAADGEEGWAMAIEHVPDLIITDVLMPKMNGNELCEKLKNADITNHVPIIMLTALPTVEDRILGLKKGADSYIPKPFEPEHLLIRVEKLIETRRSLKNKFLRNYWATPTQTPEEEKYDPALEFINKVRALVEQNLSNPEYSVGEMCKDIAMSRMQLFRKFKASMGITANKFIRLMRLQKAKQLLERGDMNVSEVTYSVGFNDLKYFRNCFREEFGITPSEYVRQLRKTNDKDDDFDDSENEGS
jgi:signal transduction histidine kinase/ligand-binding sensor domain-containing protein/DNA-binding response OmpR family regulator